MSANTTLFYTPDQLSAIQKANVPKHVAIIPDGNRRWAKQQEQVFNKGHEAGANQLIEIVMAGKELGIQAMTFYLFSTENWTRPQEEIGALMWLLQEFLTDQCQEMIDNGVRLQTIGNLKPFPNEVLDTIEKTIDATASCDRIDLIFALNYGGRDDICRAFHSMLDHYSEGKIQKEQVTEKLISSYLDTSPWGDPDLLIRTSGEMRVSNFLLWQLSYTEIFITERLWPEFKPNDLLEAVADYQKRERRLGGT